jgi:hypothetical protein
MTARYIIGDTREVTASLPDNSVDLILTSPPFLALRSYLPDDHPHKAQEIGSEATPADFLDVLLDLTEEWARVLAPHGSLCVELGDTYSGSGGAGGDYLPGGLREDQPGFGGSSARAREGNAAHWRQKNAQRDAWPLDKSLCGIPHLYHLSLAYGRNLLRPERTIEPWRVRNVVAWVRPNPPVGALGDKFRPATSYMTVATKSRTRWFDLDAVRTEYSQATLDRPRTAKGRNTGSDANDHRDTLGSFAANMNAAGAPPLDWWNIPTEPYAGSHYATWPRKLLERPIKAMCPLRVCTTCGQPSRRITGEAEYVDRRGKTRTDMNLGRGTVAGAQVAHGVRAGNASWSETRVVETIGWTDCGHNTWRSGVVLDPFAGSGTTLAVATGHGRDAIGIDIDERNADLALERVGPMFLTVEHFTASCRGCGRAASCAPLWPEQRKCCPDCTCKPVEAA